MILPPRVTRTSPSSQASLSFRLKWNLAHRSSSCLRFCSSLACCASARDTMYSWISGGSQSQRLLELQRFVSRSPPSCVTSCYTTHENVSNISQTRANKSEMALVRHAWKYSRKQRSEILAQRKAPIGQILVKVGTTKGSHGQILANVGTTRGSDWLTQQRKFA